MALKILGNITYGILGSVRELEKLKIKERSAEGIAVARAEGKYRGRKIGSLQSDSLDYYKDIQKSLKS